MTIGRVVIVGAGQAGYWVASTLREQGYAGAITLVGDELHTPYERPPLSKEVLAGSVPTDSVALASANELAALNVDMRLGVHVASIQRDSKRIVLGGDTSSHPSPHSSPHQTEALPYDALVLCTGGRARTLPEYSADSPCVHTLRGLDDALRLREALASSLGRLLIIGGGWIGLEVASVARQMGCDVVVAEAAERLCMRSVPADISLALRTLHQKHGVRVMLDTTVDSLTAKASGSMFDARLNSGDMIDDVSNVLVAAGMIANDELARDAGLVCSNGIVVDDTCRTSDAHIYAAGDVAIMRTANGDELRLESWQNAQDQGMAVARAILGQDVNYSPIPLNWSQQYDQFFQIAGYANNAASTVVRNVPSGGTICFYLDGTQHVQGAIGMNAGRDWRFARKLVEGFKGVAASDLADTRQALKALAA